jgi:uncharacterized YigZ family protein
MDDSYRTLEKQAEGGYREKGSRFIAYGFPVMQESEIKIILGGIRKKYHDASHHCYAYRLGHRNEVYRVNDDGEPSGTAGKPIYGQITSNNLTNILIIVIRYFGGNLLGTRGLIHAYRSAVSDMLSRASVVTRMVEVRLRIIFPYEMLNPVMKILKDEALVPETPVYEATCSMVLMVREKKQNKLVDRLRAIPGLTCESLPIDD